MAQKTIPLTVWPFTPALFNRGAPGSPSPARDHLRIWGLQALLEIEVVWITCQPWSNQLGAVGQSHDTNMAATGPPAVDSSYLQGKAVRHVQGYLLL